MLQNEAMKCMVDNQQEVGKWGGFGMFSVSFFPFRQSLRPFFIFLNSYFLGARESANINGLCGMFGTHLSPIRDKFITNLGHIYRKLRTNLSSQLGTNDELCPKRLWISLSIVVLTVFSIKNLKQIYCRKCDSHNRPR
jgi:hypothetical protein